MEREPIKKEPVVISVTHDDDSHSHYALVCAETGNKLWSENPTECKAQGYPVNDIYNSKLN